MHKLVCAAAVVAVYGLGILAHAQTTSQQESLRDLKGVTLVVRLTRNAKKVGLIESQIRNEVEQQLRSAGVPLLGQPRDVLIANGRRVNSFPPFLTVRIDVAPQAKAITYVVEVSVTQDSPDPQDSRAKTSVTTWHITKTGETNRRRLKVVRRDIEVAVAQFVSDFQKIVAPMR